MRLSIVLQEAYKLWELLTVNYRIRTCIHKHLFQCRESLFQNLSRKQPSERLLFSVCKNMIEKGILFYIRFLSADMNAIINA